MEENKNLSAEQADIPSAQPAQNSSEEVTPAATGISDENILPDTETPATEINPPQAKEMEVHHHGHVHEKKKWKEYVFNFSCYSSLCSAVF